MGVCILLYIIRYQLQFYILPLNDLPWDIYFEDFLFFFRPMIIHIIWIELPSQRLKKI